jgi:hypothetical protein
VWTGAQVHCGGEVLFEKGARGDGDSTLYWHGALCVVSPVQLVHKLYLRMSWKHRC